MRSILIPFAAIWLAASPQETQSHPAWPPVMPYGVIRGFVRDAHENRPLPYVNIMLVNTTMGGMSRGDGSFTMWFVPSGTYTIKAMMMAYNGVSHTGIVVRMGEVAEVPISLEARFPESRTGERSIVGTETMAVGADLRCEIVPSADTFRVGDFASFQVILHNIGKETFYLVPALDGSLEHLRYPLVSIAIDGDSERMTGNQPRMCGNVNYLMPEDFILIPPGGSFQPFDVFVFEQPLRRPGDHKVLFSYSTLEADYQFWIDRLGGETIDPRAHEFLKGVPRVKLTSSITIAVID